MEFGVRVAEQSRILAGQGRDANQIAKILCDQDPEGCNYGIGVILGGDGQPLSTSSTLLSYAGEELKASGAGAYINSSGLMGKVKEAVMRWQRIPEEHWGSFALALPSDAGTGAVVSAVETALILDSSLSSLGVQELGWPAYKTMARVARVGYSEHAADAVIGGGGVLPIYQAGPMNTTGQVLPASVIEARAEAAARTRAPIILDRAYPGFEFAHLLASEGYDAVMRRSYDLQLRPFIEAGTPFCLALSPTKAFVTFSLRPAGLLLVFEPDSGRRTDAENVLAHVIRARGSSFEHPITRAFARALTQALAELESEHAASMERVAQAEELWRRLVKGTPMEKLFSPEYAGLFRNPAAREGAAARVYSRHLYPVFSGTRCRLNVTGIPTDEALAAEHVAAFASECD
jgi:hypothetical protein